MTLYLSLTHDCQLRCNYCYAGEKYRKVMSQETILKSIEFLFKMPMQELNFGFFGGEPLLEWDLLQFATYRVEDEAKKRDIELIKTLTTNGLLLDEKKVTWLRKHGFYMVVSLDGNSSMHNTHRLYPKAKESFTQVVKGVKEIQKVYDSHEYTVVSVVTPQNIEHLNASVHYLYEELGVKNIRLSTNYYDEWGEETELYTQIYNELGNYIIECYRQNKKIKIDIFDSKIKSAIAQSCSSCSFGELKMAVAPSGRLYPCERLIGTDTGEMAMGDVYGGFNTQKRHQFISQRGNSNEECKTCEVKERCMNSCGCTNYTLTNRIDITNGVVCFFQKLFIEVADRIASTLYEEKNKLFVEKFYKIST